MRGYVACETVEFRLPNRSQRDAQFDSHLNGRAKNLAYFTASNFRAQAHRPARLRECAACLYAQTQMRTT